MVEDRVITGLWETCCELESAGTPFVVATMIASRGHAPQDPGAKCVISADGLVTGTIGGGKIEARVIADARRWIEETRAVASSSSQPGLLEPRLHTWNLQRDIGMTCGGEATVLLELHRRDAWPIVVFGAGHVAQALVRALLPLDCQVTALDWRVEWAERFPKSTKLKVRIEADAEALVTAVAALPENAYYVVMTRGHASDVPILKELFRLRSNAPYLGVMGSAVKALKMRKELSDHGVPPEQLERLHSPIGLKLGGNDPAEIAISVAAQLVQERDRIRSSKLRPAPRPAGD